MGEESGFCGCQCARDAGDGAGFVFAGEGVFPDAEDAPVFGFEEAVHFAVALAVAGDFGVPEFAVGFWAAVMNRASVPVTSVNKESDALGGKHEVGFAGEFAVAPPACDAVRAKNGDEAEFGVFVASAADAGH